MSDEQIAALDKTKRHTNFNDLAQKGALGSEALERQVRSAVDLKQSQRRGQHGTLLRD